MKLESDKNNNKDLLLAAGRFSYDKRFDICINAYSKSSIKDALPLVIIGNGDQEAELEKLARELELSVKKVLDENVSPGTVYFPGYIEGDEKIALFRRALGFLQPSAFESFGIVLLGCAHYSKE